MEGRVGGPCIVPAPGAARGGYSTAPGGLKGSELDAARSAAGPEEKEEEQQKLNDELIDEASNGNTDQVRTALTKGADVDAESVSGMTALIWAAKKGHLEVVKLLLDHKAKLEKTEKKDVKEGMTPLLWAAGKGHREVVNALIKAGANLEATNKKGQRALMHEAESGNTAVVEALINGGANLDAADEDGNTALMSAVGWEHTDVVEALINGGANLDATDEDGNTALHLDAAWEHTDIQAAIRGAQAIDQKWTLSITTGGILTIEPKNPSSKGDSLEYDAKVQECFRGRLVQAIIHRKPLPFELTWDQLAGLKDLEGDLNEDLKRQLFNIVNSSTKGLIRFAEHIKTYQVSNDDNWGFVAAAGAENSESPTKLNNDDMTAVVGFLNRQAASRLRTTERALKGALPNQEPTRENVNIDDTRLEFLIAFFPPE